jgi:hypothetical protein
MWWAHLVSTSPRYSKWQYILGSNEVPLKAPGSFQAALNGIPTECYALDLEKLSPEQHNRLIEWISKQFSVPVEEVKRDLPTEGFPIRAEDVSVAYDMRAFLWDPTVRLGDVFTVMRYSGLANLRVLILDQMNMKQKIHRLALIRWEQTKKREWLSFARRSAMPYSVKNPRMPLKIEPMIWRENWTNLKLLQSAEAFTTYEWQLTRPKAN